MGGVFGSGDEIGEADKEARLQEETREGEWNGGSVERIVFVQALSSIELTLCSP